MSTRSAAGSVVPVLLLVAAILLAAASVPALAAHSPVSGLLGAGALQGQQVGSGATAGMNGSVEGSAKVRGNVSATGSTGTGAAPKGAPPAGATSSGGLSGKPFGLNLSGQLAASVSGTLRGGASGRSPSGNPSGRNLSGRNLSGGKASGGGARRAGGTGGAGGSFSILLKAAATLVGSPGSFGDVPKPPEQRAVPKNGTPTPAGTPTPSGTGTPSGGKNSGDVQVTATGKASTTGTPTGTAGSKSGGDGGLASLADRGPGTRLLAVVGLAVVALLVYLYRSDRGVVAALAALPAVVHQQVLRLVFAVSDAIESVVQTVREAGSVLAVPRRLLARLLAWLRETGATVRAAIPGAGSPDATAGAGSGAGETASTTPARERVRDAWRTVVETVADGGYRSRTPGEIERQAIDEGLPAAEVRTLADTFRTVEYGSRDPSELVDDATRAATSLQQQLEDEPGEPGGD